jgi:hypothetical protein
MSDDQTVQGSTLRWSEPLAVESTAAVQRGQVARILHSLDTHPGLALTRIVKEGRCAGARTLLHRFADWPGHRRNPQWIVAVLHETGVDLIASADAPDAGGETPLHWAATTTMWTWSTLGSTPGGGHQPGRWGNQTPLDGARRAMAPELVA